ncbi:MAG: PQQ-like beta-propeller repeat protein [Dehalococcoidales bacterium]|nr:MAG: PQQ-like beta-propeller repeat protein [Dehalococcoidales bacterium]
MKKLKTINPIYKIALLVLVLFAVVITLPGCAATRGAVARGWAGGVIEDGVMYTASMEGNLITINTTDWRSLNSASLETQEPTSGFLSCAQGSTTVAIYSSPVIADDLVCVGGYNGKVYAFSRDEMRDEPRWVYPRQGDVGGSIIGGIIFNQGKLYFGSANNKVFSLDAADGFKEWEIELPDKIWSTPVILNDLLYLGCFDKKFYALNIADGRIEWEYETEGTIVSTPVVDGNTVYFSSFDRNLYALNAVTGSLKWKYQADNWFWTTPIIENGMIYAPCLDGKVYVLNATNGQNQEEYDFENPISSSPVIVDDRILVVTQADKQGETRNSVLHYINVKDGTDGELYTFAQDENVFAPLVAFNGKVYIQTSLNEIHEIDAKTGAKRQPIELNE